MSNNDENREVIRTMIHDQAEELMREGWSCHSRKGTFSWNRVDNNEKFEMKMNYFECFSPKLRCNDTFKESGLPFQLQ